MNPSYSLRISRRHWSPLIVVAIAAVSGCFADEAIRPCPRSGGGLGQTSPEPGRPITTKRFATIGDYLYVIAGSKMKLFDIDEASKPKHVATVEVDRDIETVLSFDDKILIGSATGMRAFDNSDPRKPVFLHEIEYASSCAPIAAQGPYAFVALRGEGDGGCHEGDSRLDIVDVSRKPIPELFASYPMKGPNGLVVVGSRLFLCDGDHLKMFDVKNPLDVSLVDSAPIECQDVLLLQEHLAVVADIGLLQFGIAQDKLILLSHLPVEGESAMKGEIGYPGNANDDHWRGDAPLSPEEAEAIRTDGGTASNATEEPR